MTNPTKCIKDYRDLDDIRTNLKKVETIQKAEQSDVVIVHKHTLVMDFKAEGIA